jgi:serine/threonine-protein kinase
LYALFAQLACELLAREDLPMAFRVLTDAVDGKLHDLQWMDTCPALEPMRTDPQFKRLRQRVDQRAMPVREMWDAFAVLLSE